MRRSSVNRRLFLQTGLAVAALPRVAIAIVPPPAKALAFQVSRNGSPIGMHSLTFTTGTGSVCAHIDAALRVGFGFITLYRYHHRATERWQDNQFQYLESETDDNGKLFRVRATRTPTGILIRATGLPDQMAPANALPLTHWAMAAMGAPLFNPQTGKILRETVRPQGPGVVKLANGTPIRATGFALAGEAAMTDWYDGQGIWAALNAAGPDGSVIAYRRV
jgi:hypothetical protein